MINFNTNTDNNDAWLTPPSIIEALGEFDLDPCSPIVRPWDTASKHYTTEDDGLIQEWEGRAFVNPPYGRETFKWIDKLATHGNGIALIFARTETKGFHTYVLDKADGIFFFKGRIKFYNADGTEAKHGANAPSCLIAFGESNVEAIRCSKLNGFLVDLEAQRYSDISS